MAESNIVRIGAFCIITLGIFGFVLGMMPSGLFGTYDTERMNFEYPDYFTQDDIEDIAYFLNNTFSLGESYEYDFDGEGAEGLWIRGWWVDSTLDWFQLDHKTFIWYPYWWDYHYFYPRNCSNLDFMVDKADLEANWDISHNHTKVTFRCDHITVYGWFVDTNITRNDIGDAWDDGEMDIGIGFGFDDFHAKYTAWDIIFRLITFQAVDSDNTVLNFLVSFPIWCLIALSVYVLILMAIPFVSA